LAVGGEAGLSELGVGLVVGRLTTESVDEGGDAAGLQPSPNASDLPGAFVEEPSRLGLGAFTTEDSVHDLEDMALLLAHGYPVRGKYAERHGSSLA
jgi:hypothetical protein